MKTVIRRSSRIKMKKRAQKACEQDMRTAWLKKRGRMIFLKEVVKRSEDDWFEGMGVRSDYWRKRDVRKVRELMRGHLGPHENEINAVLVGLGRKKKGGNRRIGKKQGVLPRVANESLVDCLDESDNESVGGLKILGWVQKNKISTNGEVEWRYARNAEGDEDDTTVDMTDALVQEHPPCVKEPPHDRFTGKVPLEIITVKYEHTG